MSKTYRNRKKREFKEYWLERIAWKVDVSYREHSEEYKFEVEGYGIISYYPMSDKLHIHRGNKWLRKGLEWIKKNLDLET